MISGEPFNPWETDELDLTKSGGALIINAR